MTISQADPLNFLQQASGLALHSKHVRALLCLLVDKVENFVLALLRDI